MPRLNKDTNADGVPDEWDGTCGPSCVNVPFSEPTLFGCQFCPGNTTELTTGA